METTIAFYIEKQIDLDSKLFLQLLDYFNCNKAYYASIDRHGSNEWKAYQDEQQELENHEQSVKKHSMRFKAKSFFYNLKCRITGKSPYVFPIEDNSVSIEDCTIENLVNYLPKDQECLWMNIPALQSDMLANKLKEEVPESVRGDCIPCDFYINLGWHDLFGNINSDKVEYISRAHCSIQLCSNEYPDDIEEYNKRLFTIPVLKMFQSELEEILGPLKKSIFYSW